MGKSKIDAAGLFLALVADAFILGALRQYGWITGIGGLVVLFVLFAYDHEGYRSAFQSLAFSSVCGFSLVLIVAAFFESGVFGSPANIHIYTEYLPVAWICATFAVLVIDRARMGSRFQESLGPRSLGIPPAALYDTAPPRYEAVESVAASPAPPAPEPVIQPEPQPVQAKPAESTDERTAMHEALPAPVAAAEAERAVPVPHRKETSIYINLIGEGITMMRTIRAEHMGKDFYLITEPMPENETWEFTTGQIVRCKKKNLSSGKGLVAVEEAPRAS